MYRRRITFLNPVLNIPWCYSASDENLQNVEHLCHLTTSESLCVDKKTGALDLRMKKRSPVGTPKKLNQTISMLKELQCSIADRNNNSCNSEASSSSTIEGQEKHTNDGVQINQKLAVVKSCNTAEEKNRRKTARPQKRTLITENTDPLRVFNFEGNRSRTFKRFKKNIPRPKVGVVLKLRNQQYESALL